MKHRIAAVSLAVAFLGGVAIAADLTSGPQVGSRVPGPFNVLNACNAEISKVNGTKTCLVWQHGTKAVAMIFTREIDDHLTSLVKKLDAEVAKANKEKKNSMGAFVVYMTDDEDAATKKLKELAEKESLKNISLTVDSVTGPPAYKVAKDAAVTVVYYKAHSVKANHAFKKGEFDSKACAAVSADLSKIQ